MRRAPATGRRNSVTYRWDILELIDSTRDWSDVVPEVLEPLAVAGHWNGITVACGTGDNMAGALGLGLVAGDAVISVGTSGTAYAVSDHPTADASGEVAGFADATGRFLPLVCTSNAAKVLDAFARLLDVAHDEFDRLALAAGTGGPVLLPYFDGERTPNRPDATGLLGGLRSDVSREQFARAAVDGVACGLLDALDSLRRHAPVTGTIMLTGGGARSTALQAVIAGLVDLPVVVATVEQAVAAGAAVQAAATFQGVAHRVGPGALGAGRRRRRGTRCRLRRPARPLRRAARRPRCDGPGVTDWVWHRRRRARPTRPATGCRRRRHPRRPPHTREVPSSRPGRRRRGDAGRQRGRRCGVAAARQPTGPEPPESPTGSPPEPPVGSWSGVDRDIPSFTVEALPVETFEGLLVVASWIGEVLDDDPPYRLDTHLHEPVECWCRLDVVPDAGSSTVSLTIAGVDGTPTPDILAVRDVWITQLNSLDWA